MGCFEVRALRGAIVRATTELDQDDIITLLPFGSRVTALAMATSSGGVERVRVEAEDGAGPLGWVSKRVLSPLEPRGASCATATELLAVGDALCGYDRAAAGSRVSPRAVAELEARGMGFLAPLLDASGPQYVVRDQWRGRASALRSAAAARLVADAGAPGAARRLRPLQPGVRGDKVLYLRALGEGLGFIEAAPNGGQQGEPLRVAEEYRDAVEGPLLAVLRDFDAVRDALIAAIAAASEDERSSTWRPSLIDGVSGLGKHEDYDLENPDDVQLACYSPEKIGYRIHRDTMDEHTTFPARLFTCIYYLNPEPDEGKLRLYLGRSSVDLRGPHRVICPGDNDPCVDVDPLLDRLIVFRSSSFHEVYPTKVARLAITQWLAGRLPPPRDSSFT